MLEHKQLFHGSQTRRSHIKGYCSISNKRIINRWIGDISCLEGCGLEVIEARRQEIQFDTIPAFDAMYVSQMWHFTVQLKKPLLFCSYFVVVGSVACRRSGGTAYLSQIYIRVCYWLYLLLTRFVTTRMESARFLSTGAEGSKRKRVGGWQQGSGCKTREKKKDGDGKIEETSPWEPKRNGESQWTWRGAKAGHNQPTWHAFV